MIFQLSQDYLLVEDFSVLSSPPLSTRSHRVLDCEQGRLSSLMLGIVASNPSKVLLFLYFLIHQARKIGTPLPTFLILFLVWLLSQQRSTFFKGLWSIKAIWNKAVTMDQAPYTISIFLVLLNFPTFGTFLFSNSLLWVVWDARIFESVWQIKVLLCCRFWCSFNSITKICI